MERPAAPLERVSESVFNMVISGDVQLDTMEGVQVVYLYPYYRAEQKVCRNLAVISGSALKTLSADVEKSIEMTEKSTGIFLSDSQKEAVRKSVISGVLVITGGPGTGKTTIINAIINVFKEND